MGHSGAIAGTLWVALLLAGCAAPSMQVAPADAGVGSARPVVVAVIDTGINPYHQAFAYSSETVPTAVLAGAEVTTIALSNDGDHAARLENDRSFWDAVQLGELYAFQGTRTMGISFGTRDDALVLDRNGHGTAVASIIARENPDAIIVSVQVDDRYCPTAGNNDCLLDPSVPAAMRWIAEQPWIDVVSISLGDPLNKPLLPVGEEEGSDFVDASRAAAASGKLIVNAAGNLPAHTLTGYFMGPPWIICVGGGESATHGETALASRGVDVIANFTDEVATHDGVDGYRYASGTSFSTPNVVGVLSRALSMSLSAPEVVALEPAVRAAAARAALNASALAWTAADWAPTANPSDDPLHTLLYPTAPIAFSPAQQGWGFVDGSIVRSMVDTMLGAAPDGPSDPATEAYMAQQHQLRESYWR